MRIAIMRGTHESLDTLNRALQVARPCNFIINA